MRASLGFVFGSVGLKKADVPSFLSEKLTSDINEIKVSRVELQNSLINFEQVLKSQISNNKNPVDIKPLK